MCHIQGWTRSRAQQQLVVHTLQSLKDKAALAFTPVEFSQNVDPFRVRALGGLGRDIRAPTIEVGD